MSFMMYLAGGNKESIEKIILPKGANRLYSQLNDRRLGEKLIEYNNTVHPINIFVDSGAYSVHTKGKEVNVDEYIEYVNARQGCFQAIAQVDKIPGEFGKPKTIQQLTEAPELSWQNYLYMRERVIDKDCLLPIFHQGEDFKHLVRMLEWTDENGKHIPYIGISPANDVSNKQKDTWLSVVFKVIKSSSNPNVKTHAFGMTSFKLLEKYPLYSADSTAWLLRAAYGVIFTPYGEYCVSDVRANETKHVSHFSAKQMEVLEQQLSRYGLTLDQVRNENEARVLNNALFFIEWAQNYEYKGTNSFQKKLF